MALRFAELLPWREFVIETSLSPDDADRVLAQQIGSRHLLQASDALFTGERRAAGRFSFTRTIHYRNSFLPIVDVEINPREAAGARVHVAMRLHGFVLAFMSIWMTGALLGGLAALAVGIAHEQPLAVLFGLLFPTFGVALCGGGFSYEARQTTELLHRIFPPAPGDPPYR